MDVKFSIMFLISIYYVNAECNCGAGEEKGLVSCTHNIFNQERGHFQSFPIDKNLPEKCTKDLTDDQNAQLEELRGKLGVCRQSGTGEEAADKESCAWKEMKKGCENPSSAPQYLIDQVNKQKCGEEEQTLEQTPDYLIKELERRFAGSCKVVDKAKELNKKIRELYPGLTGFFDCYSKEKCLEKKNSISSFQDDCSTPYGCTKEHAFGAFYNAYTKCLKNLSKAAEAKITSRCTCFAGALGLNTDEYCVC